MSAIKAVDSAAKRVATLSMMASIETAKRLLEYERKNNFLVDILYDDLIDGYWHYMSYHYGRKPHETSFDRH